MNKWSYQLIEIVSLQTYLSVVCYWIYIAFWLALLWRLPGINLKHFASQSCGKLEISLNNQEKMLVLQDLAQLAKEAKECRVEKRLIWKIFYNFYFLKIVFNFSFLFLKICFIKKSNNLKYIYIISITFFYILKWFYKIFYYTYY